MRKYKVGILGATGAVGQEFIKLLQSHPFFKIHYLAASKHSSGQDLKSALKARERHCFSDEIEKMQIYTVGEDHPSIQDCSLLFSALNTEAAEAFEEKYAEKGLALISCASTQRKKTDVAVVVPEINPEHLAIIEVQKKQRNTKGFIVAKPNCSIQSYLPALFALKKNFPISACLVTSMQAISGAGYPGLSALDITNNVIPHIYGEEDKCESEPRKVLGYIDGSKIVESDEINFSVQCNRVSVIEGHMASVSIKFKDKKPSLEQIIDLWQNFSSDPQKLALPSAPKQPLRYYHDKKRPQPRLDSKDGMSIHLGSLRACPVLDYRFVCLTNNMQRGAAGGALLSAELLVKKGYLDGRKKPRF